VGSVLANQLPRGDIVQEIIAIVSEVAHSLPPRGYDALDDGMPGG
jgi:hypothetical protein